MQISRIQYPQSALLIVGHGSTVNPDSNTPSFAHARTIRKKNIFAQVACCFWKEEPSLRDAAQGLVFDEEAIREVFVVPNFISEGYFTKTVIPRELGLNGEITVRENGQVWKYCAPVGNHPAMTDLLLKRAQEVAPAHRVPPEETTLFIVGHGTSLNDQSAVAAKFQATQLANHPEVRYAAVLNAYMEEPPLIADWATLAKTPYAVVVPFFISDGLHSYQDIPVLLGIESEPTAAASEQQVFRNNPYNLRGHTLFYASAIGTELKFADIIIAQTQS